MTDTMEPPSLTPGSRLRTSGARGFAVIVVAMLLVAVWTSRSAPVPEHPLIGVYGTAINADTKANIPVGADGQRLADRFRASTTSAVTSVRFVQRGGSGYSLGTGGSMRISIQADDGSGHPNGVVLAQASYTPGNPGGAWEKYDAVTFAAPPTLTAGRIYYVVFENTDAAPGSNYISVNNTFVYGASLTPRQPEFSDADAGLLYTAGSWGAVARGYTPVLDVAYANGAHDGISYYEAMIDNYGTISGAGGMVRERFTVSGGSRLIGSASVRVRRSSGSSPLVLTLETAGGTVIDSGSVPASSVPISAPGGDNGGAVWVTVTFATTHTLANGSTYDLRLSTASGTTYTTFPVREGTGNGFKSYAFTDGSGQATTNGSTWTDLYQSSPEDLQFYLR